MAIVLPPEEEVSQMPPSITADFCFEHINHVNRELRNLRSDYTTVRHVLCFWQPQLDKMATWLWELRQMHQGIAHSLEQLGECPREIVGIQVILQQLFDGMNKLNSEEKTMQKKQQRWKYWVKEKHHQIDELQIEIGRAQEKTNEQVEELERKCCGKLTEHHEWLTDLERRNESMVQEIKAQKLNVGRLEENLDVTEQSMQKQI